MHRHFAFEHPTFGTSKTPKTASHWKKSVYYWWFEYLRRNEDYKKTCQSDGKGKCAKLYEDFGDIHAEDFKTWWATGDRGASLFAEPPTPSIQVIQPDSGVLGTTGNRSLVLEVPLDLPINYLVARFRKIVSTHHGGKKGLRQSSKSQARYRVHGKVDVAFLETALLVWDQQRANPTKPLWQIAHELRVISVEHRLTAVELDAKYRHSVKRNDSPEVQDKKNLHAATASRYLKKAEAMIANVGKGIFPKSSLN